MPHKYKAVATVTWDMECDGDPRTIAREQFLSQVGNPALGFKLKINLNPVKEKKQPKKVVLGTLTPEEVFAKIVDTEAKQIFLIGEKPHSVRTNSLRLKTFQRDACKCVCCGLVGTKMLLEQFRGQNIPHFNLYGEEDGREVLFTQDHIIPLSANGPTTLENLQTMCFICNTLKGDRLLTNAQLMAEREEYQRKYQKGLKTVAEQKKAANAPNVTAAAKKSDKSLRFVTDVAVYLDHCGKVYYAHPTDKKPHSKAKDTGVRFAAGAVVKVKKKVRKTNLYFEFAKSKECRVPQEYLEIHHEPDGAGEQGGDPRGDDPCPVAGAGLRPGGPGEGMPPDGGVGPLEEAQEAADLAQQGVPHSGEVQ